MVRLSYALEPDPSSLVSSRNDVLKKSYKPVKNGENFDETTMDILDRIRHQGCNLYSNVNESGFGIIPAFPFSLGDLYNSAPQPGN